METFVFKEMNRASREKDTNKIKMYGPFACALSYIIYCGNSKNSTSEEKEFRVYRGFSISEEELQRKYKMGQKIKLPGYTSTTRRREKGIEFTGVTSLTPNPDKIPLLMQITIRGKSQFFQLNSKDYSAYPLEQEVLL